MFFKLAWVVVLFTLCSGKEFFAVADSNLLANETCRRYKQSFQPCNLLESYSNMFAHHRDGSNTSIILLDNMYTIRNISQFFFTGSLVEIRPWKNSSLATLDCTHHKLNFHFEKADILLIQSVKFLKCGSNNNPVMFLAKANTKFQLVQIMNSNFIQSDNVSLQILSNINKLLIINCNFIEGVAGAVFIVSDITEAIFKNVNFTGNSATSLHFQSPVFESKTSLSLKNCNFVNNTSQYSRSTIVLRKLDNVTVIGSHFIRNSPHGAAKVEHINNITVKYSSFCHNKARSGGALHVSSTRSIQMVHLSFSENKAAHSGGALYVNSTIQISITSCAIFKNIASSGNGGSLFINTTSQTSIAHSTFRQNSAPHGEGGAVHASNGSYVFNDSNFINNSARLGGALSGSGTLILPSLNTFRFYKSIFTNNHADKGGALLFNSAKIELAFSNWIKNSATTNGGAIQLDEGTVVTAKSCSFLDNKAKNGGAALEMYKGTMLISHVRFTSNLADTHSRRPYSTGGALRVVLSVLVITKTHFERNEAVFGGALEVKETSKVVISDCFFSHNRANFKGGAMSLYQQIKVQIKGCSFFNNSAQYGGAMTLQFVSQPKGEVCGYTDNATLDFMKEHSNFTLTLTEGLFNVLAGNSTYNVMVINCTFTNNTVFSRSIGRGGAISIHGLRINGGDPTAIVYNSSDCDRAIVTNCTYQGNIAQKRGGGIYSNTSNAVIQNTTFFKNFAREKGGGLYLGLSEIYFPAGQIVFSSNNVSPKWGQGGAIYIEQTKTDCKEYACPLLWANESALIFLNNVASKGSMIFGGMLYQCSSFLPGNSLQTALSRIRVSGKYDYDLQSYDITSKKIKICFCSAMCESRVLNYSLYSGQTFTVSVMCIDQLRQPLNCIVESDYTPGLDIEFGQGEHKKQITGCQNLTYHSLARQTGLATLNIRSDGICEGLSWSILQVNITIRPCPLGFQLYDRQCRCDKRLSKSFKKDIHCNISNESIILEKAGWLSYRGGFMRIHNHCLLDYCYKGLKIVIPEKPDSQCAYNRGGILCGGCVANYSVVLGSWKCMNCSHLSRYNFFWLTVLLALAGVVLVVFLLLVKMTVSSGTTNGLIFNANILSFSGLLDYGACSIHPVLRVFLSWINLDLGIEVCYYSGMSVYQKTWLQFIFPFYIWFLVGVIILFCHYSSRVMKLMGMRNIEVLATLFLLSYAKLLNTIVTTFSFTDIMVAQADNVSDPLLPTRVWVFDGSLKYLGDKHLPLFIISFLFLLLLFLPYTLLLSIGQYLYLLPNRNHLKMFHSTVVTTVMDAYHAPYSKSFRSWTGICLLIRCFLFTIFAVSHTMETKVFWTAVAVVFLLALRIFAVSRVYQKKLVDALEFFNLLILLTLMIAFYKDQFCKVLTAAVAISAITFGFTVILHIIQEMKKSGSFSHFMEKISTSTKWQLKRPVQQESEASNNNEPSTSYVEFRETLIGP